MLIPFTHVLPRDHPAPHTRLLLCDAVWCVFQLCCKVLPHVVFCRVAIQCFFFVNKSLSRQLGKFNNCFSTCYNVDCKNDKLITFSDTPFNTPRDDVFAFDEIDSPQSCSSTLSSSPTAKWETVVVLAVSLSRLDVSTNMANVMGKTRYTIPGFQQNERVFLPYICFQILSSRIGCLCSVSFRLPRLRRVF